MGMPVAAEFVSFCYRKPDPDNLGKLLTEDIRINGTTSSDKKDLVEIISNPFSYGENKIFPWRIESVSYQPDNQNRSVKVEISIQSAESAKTRRSLILIHKLFFEDDKICRIDSQCQTG